MPTTAEAARLARVLGIEQRHPELVSPSVYGVEVEPIRDPILRTLAEYPDWREYGAMFHTPEIWGPWDHVTAALSDEPLDVLIGRSGSPAAERLRERAEWLLTSLPDMPTIREKIIEAYWFGWRPMQQILGQTTPPGGGSVWAPVRLVDQAPEWYRWTRGAEGERSLLFAPTMAQEMRTWSPEEVRAGWLCPRVGSLSSPYGIGLAPRIWLLWRVAKVVARKFYSGVDRRWNMTRIKPGSKVNLGPNQTVTEAIRDVQQDVDTVLEYLHSRNTLLELGSWTVDWVDVGQFVADGVGLMTHLETKARILIGLQTLTASTADSGPAGSSSTHERMRLAAAQRIAEKTLEPALEGLVENHLWLNEPGEVDPDDLPRVRSRIRHKADLETVRQLYDMGATLELQRTAEALRAERILATAEELKDPEAQLLKKGPGLTFGDIFAGTEPLQLPPAQVHPVEDKVDGKPQAAQSPQGEPRTARRTAGTAAPLAELQRRLTVQTTEEVSADVAPVLGSAVEDLLSAYRAGPGKAPAPHRPGSGGSTETSSTLS